MDPSSMLNCFHSKGGSVLLRNVGNCAQYQKMATLILTAACISYLIGYKKFLFTGIMAWCTDGVVVTLHRYFVQFFVTKNMSILFHAQFFFSVTQSVTHVSLEVCCVTTGCRMHFCFLPAVDDRCGYKIAGPKNYGKESW